MFQKIVRYRLRRPVLIIAACLALFAGVFLARVIAFEDARWLWIIAVPLYVSLRSHNAVTLVLLVALFLCLGWWRGSAYMQKLAVHQALQHQTVTLVGHATEDAVYGKRYQLEFAVDQVQISDPAATPLVGSLAVSGFGESAVYRGDTVMVTGKLYPRLGNNLGGISFATITVVERGNFWVDTLRRRFAAGMQSALPEPAASFALGLLIGQRTTLPEDVSTQLQHVGLTHVIAVSGYNLTILVIACRRMFASRSKFQTIAACLGLLAVFLLITGNSPPIVRASLISVLGLWAWYYGHSVKPLVLLLVSAAITVLANPLYAWGNVSWYLSFLAFAGVLILAPLVAKRLLGSSEPPLLVAVLIETCCANIAVLPYILFIFGQVSVVSIPANLLVVPLVPLAMLFGLAAGVSGMLVPFVAGWVSWPAKVLLTYMLDSAQLLSRIPQSFIRDIGFSWQSMLLAYAIMGSVILVLWHKTKTRPNVKATPLQD